MKTSIVLLPKTQQPSGIKRGEQQHTLKIPDKSPSSGPTDVWSFQKQVYHVPEGEFPQGLADAFRTSDKLPRPQFPQRYDESKFSIYGQPSPDKENPSRWAALIEHKEKVIASVTPDGENYNIKLLDTNNQSGLISKEELMEAIEGAKDELELRKFLPASK